MANKKNEKKEKKLNEESFIYKYKNDKKYKAKIELTGYVLFILLTVLFINVSSTGNTPLNDNIVNETTNNNIQKEEDKEKDLLSQINNNYQYDITINLTKTTEETINYHYYGKSYDNKLEINKDINKIINTYYKIDDYYYTKEENKLTTKEVIYDLIPNNYIELNNLLEYINESSLDHVTNYSSGKKESLYNLHLKDIIINNKTEEKVTINVLEENDILTINVDYTNLLKEIDSTIKEIKINYTFSNIGKVEEFSNLEENKGENNE